MEALKYIWEGAIPLQIHLHESEVTTVPPPPPAMVLAPRIGYLPLLASQIKPYFSSTLPPGVDTIWFEYKGLPLKWNIPTGVLFDLLCAEPERPWNLTANYIVNGNTKNVMSMSEPDLVELWRSVSNGDLEAYLRISSKLKLGGTGHENVLKSISTASLPGQSTGEMDIAGQPMTGRIPVRLYVRNLGDDFDNLEDAPPVNNWDDVSYINRPVEIHEEGKCFTLHDAVRSLFPELFIEKATTKEESTNVIGEEQSECTEPLDCTKTEERGPNFSEEHLQSYHPSIKLVRIQGIEPKCQIPFSWVVNNLMNPEYFLHICVFVSVQQVRC
ncbi:autophagy protein 5 isoform X4 [Benincasa hispida]|uniref:autophagy protein 5 isoform X4 n=1 Tax=Benincasa hispida TaxID=102211 RepID=UPI001900D373|nr:autophagy protein 5 isoform X4 [Benincasa hispida]